MAVPLIAATGWVAAKTKAVAAPAELPPPVPGRREDLASEAGRLAVYSSTPDGPADPTPLLLVHSVNAAASAYEVRPIFERAMAHRTVYALDLPGYGFSERGDRAYGPRLMTDAVTAVTELIRSRHGRVAVDALALSLSSEFLARAVSERPEAFRSAALISPTGFDKRGPRNGAPCSDRGMPKLHKTFTGGPWRRPLFNLLTSRVSIRYFLEKTFGSKTIDEGLLDYDYLTTHQPGAEFAPYRFISGFLFSNDITRVYDQLQLPVWMVHGTRGDFQDYTGKTRVADRPNWTITVMDTGALPEFEIPDVFQAQYEAFLAGLQPQ